MTPVHVVADPGDRVSLCGVRHPLPVVAAKWVDAHRRGRDVVICPDCLPLSSPTPAQGTLL